MKSHVRTAPVFLLFVSFNTYYELDVIPTSLNINSDAVVIGLADCMFETSHFRSSRN
jgi:hypothetical protein